MSLKPRKATKHAPTLSGVFLLILCAGTLTSGYTSAAAQSKPSPAAGMAKQRDPNTSSPGAKGSQSIDDAKAGPVQEANRPAGEVALNPDSKRATMEEGEWQIESMRWKKQCAFKTKSSTRCRE